MARLMCGGSGAEGRRQLNCEARAELDADGSGRVMMGDVVMMGGLDESTH